MKKKIKIILIAIGSLLLISFVILMYTNNSKNKQRIDLQHIISNKHTDQSEDNIADMRESIYDYIFQLRIEHADIVFAQCIEESGNFTSDIFVNANNCLGMKVPSQRITFAVGTYKNHARYKSWHDCINDYAIWQTKYARNLTDDEYFAFLDKIYAEASGYSDRLKNIIKKF